MTQNTWKWLGASAMIVATLIGCGEVQHYSEKAKNAISGVGAGVEMSMHAQTLGEKDEPAYGRSMAIAATNQYTPSDNKQLLEYVNYIGYTLASVSPEPDRHYLFGVLDSDTVGAFSGPDGYIFITRGAILFAHDEAEVAGVIGHEMTHVLNQDGIEAAKGAMTAAGITKATASAIGVDQASPAIDKMNQSILSNGFDKPQEYAADKGAMQLLIAAGYDPVSFLHYLKRLEIAQQGDGGGSFMSTHPGVHDRIARLAENIGLAGIPGGATLRDRFMASVYPVAPATTTAVQQ
jgi:beta-barrel assembly-enhancing protease